MVSVRWTGAAGLEFTHEGRIWLIDPYVSRIGKIPLFFGRPRPDEEKIARYLNTLPGRLQGVIVSHTHLDHALDVPDILRKTPVPLIGSESLETLMALHGMAGRTTVCIQKTRVELPGGDCVTMIPSLHGLVLFGRAPYAGEVDAGQTLPLKASRYRHGRVFIIRLEVGGKAFMHIGTANLIDGELDGETCDVLFLCVPGWKAVPNYLGRILSRVRPKIVVPFHFDDFSAPIAKDRRSPFWSARTERLFLDGIVGEAPDARIVYPSLFQVLTF